MITAQHAFILNYIYIINSFGINSKRTGGRRHPDVKSFKHTKKEMAKLEYEVDTIISNRPAMSDKRL